MAKIASKSVDTEQGLVTITPEGGEAITANLSELPDEMIRQLALHGLSQKLGDSYAGAGQEESPAAVVEANVTSLLDQLKQGVWSSRSGGGGGGARVTILAEAIHRVTGKELDECVRVVGEMEKDAKAEWRKHPQIAKAISEIRAEREQEKAEKLAKQEDDGSAPDLGSLF